MTARSHYFPALDGVRAVAVVAVVVFHADRAAPMGFLGVDVFFVLSGFLITGLLVAEIERTGRINLVDFYRRRFLRLFPALLLVCLCVAAAAVVLSRATASNVLAGVVAALFYVANLWQASGHAMPLLEHTWTLALEWQFYLVWPFVVLLVRRARVVGLALLGVGLVFPWVAVAADLGPVGGSYARSLGLVVGSVLALALRHGGRWVAPLAALAAPTFLALVLLLLLPISWPLPVQSFLEPAAVVLVVPAVVASTRSSVLTPMLAWHPLVWLGARSYGIYLWHFPILSVLINQVGQGTPLVARLALGMLLTVATAAASYRWVEQPVIGWGRARQTRAGRSQDLDVVG